MASDPRDTPAMRQYARFKKTYPDCLLMFRMGDFYEMFDDDAVTASKAIGLTLTQRTTGIPMAGVPYHQLDIYARKLIAAGFRVAICDQLEDPAEAKAKNTVIERGVTSVLTPGTLIDENLLDDDTPNVLAAVCFPPESPSGATVAKNGTPSLTTGQAAIAIAELSTGHFIVLSVEPDQVADELARRRVTELLYPEASTGTGGTPPRLTAALKALAVSTTPQPQWHFRPSESRQALLEQFNVSTLAGFGLDDGNPLVAAAGALVRYLRATQLPGGAGAVAHGSGQVDRSKAALSHLRPPRVETLDDHLTIDAVSLRALEVDRTIRSQHQAPGAAGQRDGSLVGVFTTPAGRPLCRTPMGKRLLRDWLCRPLRDVGAISARQRAVALFCDDLRYAGELVTLIEPVQDVARIAARVALRRCTPRDIVALGRSLACIGKLRDHLTPAPALIQHAGTVAELTESLEPLAEAITRSCNDSPPPHLREGGLIRDGIDAALDEARALKTDASKWAVDYQLRLQTEHNLPNLKVGFNKIFGYYIELPKAQAQRAPDAFSRRQTLTNAERYITPELKAYEDKVAHADTRALAREQALFDDLCDRAAALIPQISAFAQTIAELDVLLAFAAKSFSRRWCCPQIVDQPILSIKGGRHPVVEELMEQNFVPNDLSLATADSLAPLALITGPNMAGKSTFIRQTALITLLAHTGCFVPATSATIGVCDRIFTRVGADDALFAGQSTFMVEMTETANILHHATPRSLVILDEIGRGTSTLDGLSLAWAIAETLAGTPPTPSPRTLFATHYHELTQLQELMPQRVTNLHVAVREWQDQIIFLHRILQGRADKSYGIHVAKLAGLPTRTVQRAKQVLECLEVDHSALINAQVQVVKKLPPSKLTLANADQPGLFA
ncbi:MAG: DNA mismatch repair protein MutS [Phycisphaerales bacterium]